MKQTLQSLLCGTLPVLLTLLLLPQAARAQSEKAIYCANNTTLYFVYDNNTYAVGNTFTDNEGTSNEITAVYTEFLNTGYTNQNIGSSWISTAPWGNYYNNITIIDFLPSFKNCASTTFKHWFYGLTALTTVKNGSNLNTSEATNMSYMFCNDRKLATIDVSTWDTGNVTTLTGTFSACSSLTTLEVSKWNTEKVTDMSTTFINCTALISLGATNVSNWNTANTTSISGTFSGCNNLTVLDVSKWNTENVIYMSSTFNWCRTLKELDVSNWNTGNVKNMSSTFNWCSNLTALDVSKWNTEKVTDMSYTFCGCSGITSLDVSNWNTANVTTLRETFSNCIRLTTLDVSKWNTEKVKTLYCTFCSAKSLTGLDVSNWNTANVTTLEQTFLSCGSLTALNVNNWNTANVTDMSNTFSSCHSLTTLDVSGWNTRKVTSFTSTFASCRLTSLTFGKDFSMEKVTNAKDMFYGDGNLRYIDFYDSDDTDAITAVTRTTSNTMFYNLPATTVIYLPHGSQEVTDTQNVVYSYGGDETDLRCPNYYSEDQVDIEFPRDFKTNKAEYTRSTGNTYGSTILPYAFTTNDDVQAYTLNQEYDTYMYFVDAETIPAHTPFAFKKKGSAAKVPFTMEDASSAFGITVYATKSTCAAETTWDGSAGTPYTDDAAAAKLSGWSTKGYYVAEKVSDYDDAFYISKDKFYKASGALTMYPHRVTFHGTWTKGSPASDGDARYFNIGTGDDETLAIEAADLRQTEREARAIYDAQGRRHDSLSKGLNIVRMEDGTVKKILKKN